MRFIPALLFIVVLAVGCKPKQNAVTAPAPKAEQTAPSETSDELQALNNLVISLYSTGEGANQNAVATIETFLEEYSAKGKPVPYSKIYWGREGEVDFCISLLQLNPGEQRAFMDNMRSMIKQFELIHFLENRPCRDLK